MYALYESTLPSLSYQMLMYDQPIVRALLESQNSPSLDLAFRVDYHPEGNFVWKFHRSLHIVSRFSEATNPSSFSASVGSAVRSGTSPSLCRQLLLLCYFRNLQPGIIVGSEEREKDGEGGGGWGIRRRGK